MKTRRLLQFAVTSLAETTWRRLRGEPVADAWPFQFELLWSFIRRRYRHMRDEDIQTIRTSEEEMAVAPRGELSRIPTEFAGVDCEWFLADPDADTAPAPEAGAVVYLHGGGYVFGSTNTHADLLGRLTRRIEAPILGVNYSLCPEASLDDAVDEAVAVVRTLVDRGWSPDDLAVAGDSAGGGLTVSTALALRDRHDLRPAALGLLSPWADLRCDGTSHRVNTDTDYMTGEMVTEIAERVCHDRPLDDPVASPVLADHHDLPPTLVHAGGAEVLLDDSRNLADRMCEAGVDVELKVWPEMVHVFHNFSRLLPTGERALDEFADFLDDALPSRDARTTRNVA
jgi:phosphinothricin tripeptide acetyl hydrolase